MQILLFMETPGKCQEGTPGRSETAHSKSANMHHSKQAVKWKASFRLICGIKQKWESHSGVVGGCGGGVPSPRQDPSADEVGDQSPQLW